jgi:hypothetical protein
MAGNGKGGVGTHHAALGRYSVPQGIKQKGGTMKQAAVAIVGAAILFLGGCAGGGPAVQGTCVSRAMFAATAWQADHNAKARIVISESHDGKRRHAQAQGMPVYGGSTWDFLQVGRGWFVSKGRPDNNWQTVAIFTPQQLAGLVAKYGKRIPVKGAPLHTGGDK